MKQIGIGILAAIILIFAYREYKDYRRFNPPNSEYQTTAKIDLDFYDQTYVQNYFHAKEALNAFVLQQYTVCGIDVRNPKKDDNDTKNAVNLYVQKLGQLKFFESKLSISYALKKTGLSNKEIETFGVSGLTKLEFEAAQNQNALRKIFEKNPLETIQLGDVNQFVMEMQKALVRKGYQIPVDGIFNQITKNALNKFETKNNLFVDGKLDLITLNKLLE